MVTFSCMIKLSGCYQLDNAWRWFLSVSSVVIQQKVPRVSLTEEFDSLAMSEVSITDAY